MLRVGYTAAVAARRAEFLDLLRRTPGAELFSLAAEPVSVTAGLVASAPPMEVLLSYAPDIVGADLGAMLAAQPALRSIVLPHAGVPPRVVDTLLAVPAAERPQLFTLHHNAAATAEVAVGLMISLARRFRPCETLLREHQLWERFPAGAMTIANRRVTVLGWGEVGRRVGRTAVALGAKVTALRRGGEGAAATKATASAPGVSSDEAVVQMQNDPEKHNLHRILPQTEVLVVCLPGTPATAGLISSKELALMPPGAMIINVGRASVIDEDALWAWIEQNPDNAFGSDVWWAEAPFPKIEPPPPPTEAVAPGKHPWHTRSNVAMLPHLGGAMNLRGIEQERADCFVELLRKIKDGSARPTDLAAGY